MTIKKYKKNLKNGVEKIYEYDSKNHKNWFKTRPDLRYNCICGKQNVSHWRRKDHEKGKKHKKIISEIYSKRNALFNNKNLIIFE